VEKLLNFVQDAVDKYFDKFELYCLSNVFRVPPHAKLDGDLPADDEMPSQAEEVSGRVEEEGVGLCVYLPMFRHLLLVVSAVVCYCPVCANTKL
jgi:hypothetical protein